MAVLEGVYTSDLGAYMRPFIQIAEEVKKYQKHIRRQMVAKKIMDRDFISNTSYEAACKRSGVIKVV